MNNKKLSDGIYLVNAHGGKILYTGKNAIKDCKGVKYIGIKKDSKAICIALKDLRGRKPLTCRSDNTENYNNYISDKNLVASDWNGKKNTEHLKEVKNSKEYNNLEVRIAFDIARACGEYRRLTTKYSNNDDVNDNHLKTLFVQCFRELHIKL